MHGLVGTVEVLQQPFLLGWRLDLQQPRPALLILSEVVLNYEEFKGCWRQGGWTEENLAWQTCIDPKSIVRNIFMKMQILIDEIRLALE